MKSGWRAYLYGTGIGLIAGGLVVVLFYPAKPVTLPLTTRAGWIHQMPLCLLTTRLPKPAYCESWIKGNTVPPYPRIKDQGRWLGPYGQWERER